MYNSNKKILLLLNFSILISRGLSVSINKDVKYNNIIVKSFLKNNKNIYFQDNLINNENINKRGNYCVSKIDCNFNQNCFNNVCYDDISNFSCVLTSKDDKFHQGNCSEPYYCENNKCHSRIPYEGNCEESKYYQCTLTNDSNEPKCIDNKCRKYYDESPNFLSSIYGKCATAGFIIFLIILFITVYKIVTKQNEKNEKFNEQKSSSFRNIDDYHSSNVLNPSAEESTYMRSVKNKNIESDKRDNASSSKRDIILSEYITSDPQKIVNYKKDSDITGNLYSITPQSASTLINKSYTSSNNLIDKKSTLHEYLSNSYQGNSIAAVSSPNETSVYSPSFKEFNSGNSYPYFNPSDSRRFNSFNTYNNIISSPAPASHFYSLSSPKKLLPIDIPISPINTHDEYGSSSSIPYILDMEGAAANDDNQTTLSFDEGVIKISNTKSNSSQDCNIQETIIYSYSESNSCHNNIFFSQDINTPLSKKEKSTLN